MNFKQFFMIVALVIFASVSTEGFTIKKSFESESAAEAISQLYSQNEKDEECGTIWKERRLSGLKNVYKPNLLAGSDFTQKVRIGEWYVRNNISVKTAKNKNYFLSPKRQTDFPCTKGFCKDIPNTMKCRQLTTTLQLFSNLKQHFIVIPTRCAPVPIQISA